jgi:hypothetical protein
MNEPVEITQHGDESPKYLSDEVPRQPRPLMTKLARIQGKLDSVEKRGQHDYFNYPYLKIGDVYDALRPLMGEEGVSIVPHLRAWRHEPAKTSGGKETTRHTIEVDWAICDGESGDTEVVAMPGEALDSEDKGLQKALSASHKALLISVFQVSGEDPEAGSGQQQGTRPARQPSQPDKQESSRIVTKIVKGLTAADGKSTIVGIDGGTEFIAFHGGRGDTITAEQLRQAKVSGADCIIEVVQTGRARAKIISLKIGEAPQKGASPFPPEARSATPHAEKPSKLEQDLGITGEELGFPTSEGAR